MKESDKDQLKKYFFWATILILILLSYNILKSFLIPLISSFVLAYLLIPVYNLFNKKLGKSFSAILCVLLILLILIVPLGAIIAGVTSEAYSTLNDVEFNLVIEKISSMPVIEKLNINIEGAIQNGVMFLISLLSSAAYYLPSLFISLIVLLFGLYYILTNWGYLSNELKNYLPFEDKQKISKEIELATRGLVLGSVLIAVIEFVIAAIGFYIFGINFYLLLSTLIFFFAFIPGLGPTIVWVPLVVYLAFIGDYYSLIGVLITGIILSVGIDTVLRAKLIGKKSNINPFIMLIGILGGISMFGIFGFIIGPLILVYTIKILQEYFNN